MLRIHVLVYTKSIKMHKKSGANTETINAVESMNTLSAFIAATKVSEPIIEENARECCSIITIQDRFYFGPASFPTIAKQAIARGFYLCNRFGVRLFVILSFFFPLLFDKDLKSLGKLTACKVLFGE